MRLQLAGAWSRFGSLTKKTKRKRGQVKRKTNNQSELITRNELCCRLRISRDTLRRHLIDGPPDGSEGDVRKIKQHKRGSKVFWIRKSVDAFINGKSERGDN